MGRRTFRPKTNKTADSQVSEVLLTQQAVAVYYRQSTLAQVGNVSTAMQTVDMIAELQRRGWHRDNIILIDVDEGVSGTKRIDEREGMSYLFELIADKKIGAVACQDEDRLFRDWTQIQVNIFIDTCRKSNVKVITPSFIYDFTDPLTGDFHARQFRFKCDMAAEYIKTYVLGRLKPAKQRLAKEGLWVGGKIPVGYMVDMRKKLPNGADNPDWHRFFPFEPYAEIVREYFRVFLDNGGVTRKALRQIRHDRISFPNCEPPEGFKANYKLKWREDGYYLNRGSYLLLLTNPVYIGHRYVDNTVVQWDNHPPIVETDIFMKAFNYLSTVTLTGEPNPDYKPSYQYVRLNLEGERPVDAPLCTGLIYSQVADGRWFRAGLTFDKRTLRYLYVLHRSEIDGTQVEWARRAEWIDQAIVSRFKQKLTATFQTDTWSDTIKVTQQLVERERKVKRIQLASLQDEMQNLVASIKTLKHPYLIQEVENRYVQMEKEEERLTHELAALEHNRQKQVSVEQAYALFEQALASWDEMTQDERRNVLGLCINRIEASDYDRSGKMKLQIEWRDGSCDTIQLWHKSKADHWTIENSERLLGLLDEGAGQLEIAAAFPNLKWEQIYNEIRKHRGIVRFTPSYLGKKETYNDFLARGGGKGKASGSYWLPEENQHLKDMVENGANQLEIMKAFPYRRWIRIQERVKILCGKGSRVKRGEVSISQDLTYTEYVGAAKTMNDDVSCR